MKRILNKTRIDVLVKDKLLPEDKIPTFEAFWAGVKDGPVRFSYQKRDGSIRYALGTINPESVKDLLDHEEYGYFSEVFDLDQLQGEELSLFGSTAFPDTFHYIDLSGDQPGIRQFDIKTLVYPE